MNMFLGKDIEVTGINPKEHLIGFLIHLRGCKPNEIATPAMREKTNILVRKACEYLINEGFISKDINWGLHIGGVSHL